MKVLWLCNICPPAVAAALGQSYSVREGWITGALNSYLSEETGACFSEDGSAGSRPAEGIELGICFPGSAEQKELSIVLELKGQGGSRFVKCYAFQEDLTHPETYTSSMEGRMNTILQDFLPDLVHVFGTEFPHALAMTRVWNCPERTLVGMQGVMHACADAYMADLPEQVRAGRTFRDILRKDSLMQQQEKFHIRAGREREILQNTAYVAGRTAFDREGTTRINPLLNYLKLKETMRECFYQGRWQPDSCRPYEIFISQGDYPLKGFHYLLQAMPDILREFPAARIKAAGNSITACGSLKEKLKLSGYGAYLRKLMQDNGLTNKVTVSGSLTAEEMKQAYLECQVFVCPSAIENSPNSLGEAMLLGVPCVASDTGGIPDLAEDGISALLFEKANVHALAEAVKRIFRDRTLSLTLSEGAVKKAVSLYDREANYRRMMEIYRLIIGKEREAAE